jgi:excisionase family DNA binding protein
MLQNYPDVLTVQDVSKILHCGENTVYDLLRSGELRSIRPRTKYLIPRRFILAFLGCEVYDNSVTETGEVTTIKEV